MQEFSVYMAARQTLSNWIDCAQALALLRAAVSSGVLDALRAHSTVAQIAIDTGVDETRVADLCVALDACGILDCQDGHYELSPEFAILTSPTAPQTLLDFLNWQAVKDRALEAAASPPQATCCCPLRIFLQ